MSKKQDTPTAGTRAIGYIRYSSPNQSKGDSIRRQTANIVKYAKTHGLVLDTDNDIYEDRAKSAYTGKNTATLDLILEAMDTGVYPKGTTLIIESFDRISRQQITKALATLIQFPNVGYNLVTIDDNEKFYDHENIDAGDLIMSIIILGRAHSEITSKKSRIAEKRVERLKDARAGNRMFTTTCPAWYTSVGLKPEDKTLVLNDHAATFRRIIDIYLTENIGAGKIAKRLNDEGVKTVTIQDRQKPSQNVWRGGYISQVLRKISLMGHHQPTVVVDGERVNNGDVIKGYYNPPLISEEKFYQLQAKIGESKKFNNGRPTQASKFSNVLKSVVKCDCGVTLHYMGKKGTGTNEGKYYRYLFCPSKCGFKAVNYDAILDNVLDLLPTYTSKDLRQQNMITQGQNKMTQGKIDVEVASVTDLRAAYKKSKDPTILEMIAETNANIDKLKSEMKPLVYNTGADADLDKVVSVLSRPSEDDKDYTAWAEDTRDRVLTLIESIDVRRYKYKRGKTVCGRIEFKDGSVKTVDLHPEVVEVSDTATWGDYTSERELWTKLGVI